MSNRISFYIELLTFLLYTVKGESDKVQLHNFRKLKSFAF